MFTQKQNVESFRILSHSPDLNWLSSENTSLAKNICGLVWQDFAHSLFGTLKAGYMALQTCPDSLKTGKSNEGQDNGIYLWLSKTENVTVTPTFWNDRPGVEKCESRQSSMLLLCFGRSGGVALSERWRGKWLKPASSSAQQPRQILPSP